MLYLFVCKYRIKGKYILLNITPKWGDISTNLQCKFSICMHKKRIINTNIVLNKYIIFISISQEYFSLNSIWLTNIVIGFTEFAMFGRK